MLIAISESRRPRRNSGRYPVNAGSEAKRLRGLESENAKLKKLLADAMLDNAALKDLLAKKW